MANAIRVYFDFASPYAYAAVPGIEAIGREHGRELDWRPMLLWAVLEAQDIAMPVASAAKWRYLEHDMQRSAAFHGVPYNHPGELLPLSSHRAARLYLAATAADPARAPALRTAIFRALFVETRDISDAQVLADIAVTAGLTRDEASAMMDGTDGRARLKATIDAAVADGVCGSPFFIVDGEGFFGADRLPQIAWRLAGGGGDGDVTAATGEGRR